jgi:pimeloyl-ACP methyl ester carboxylesterase
MTNLAPIDSTTRSALERPSNSAHALAETTLPPWVDTTQYPYATRSFEHADGRLHYVDEGNGSPLLFIHGTPSWSFEWRAAIDHYRARYRCVAIDHLGFGLSDKPHDGAYQPKDHTRRLHDFIRTLDLRDITLVVHDFGGPIALPLIVREASRFRRVALVNTWAWSMDDNAKGRSLMRFIRSPLGRFLYLSCNASPRWLLPACFAQRAKLTPSIHRQYLSPFPNRASRMSLWTLGANLVDSTAFAPDFTAVVPALRALPTALIWGKRDTVIDQTVLAHWRDLLPETPISELEHSGHFPQEETPGEFIRALDAFLSM